MPKRFQNYIRQKASSLKFFLRGQSECDNRSEGDRSSLCSEGSVQSYRKRSYSCDCADLMMNRTTLLSSNIPRSESPVILDKRLSNNQETSKRTCIHSDAEECCDNIRRCWSEDEINKKTKKKSSLKRFLCVIPEVDRDEKKHSYKSSKSFKDNVSTEATEDIYESFKTGENLSVREENTVEEQNAEPEQTGARPKTTFKEPATSSGISSLSFCLEDSTEGPMLEKFLESAHSKTAKGHSSSTPDIIHCQDSVSDGVEKKNLLPGNRTKSMTNITASGNLMINFIEGNASDCPTSPSAVMAVSSSQINTETERLQEKTNVQMKQLESRQSISDRYIFTKALEFFTKDEGSRIVIILGYTGDGKTATGMYLLKTAVGFKHRYLVRSVKEWCKITIKEKRRPNTIVFLENLFGIEQFNRKQYENWEPVLDEIYSACTEGNVSVIIAIHKRVFKYYISHCRRHSLFAQEFTMDLSNEFRLTETEKSCMITHHLKGFKNATEVHICPDKAEDNTKHFNGNGVLHIWKETIQQIQNLDYPNGFPKAIERFASSVEYIKEGVDFFLKPNDETVKAIDEIRGSKDPLDRQICFAIGTLLSSKGGFEKETAHLEKIFPDGIATEKQRRTRKFHTYVSLKESLSRRMPDDSDPYLYLIQGLEEIRGLYVEIFDGIYRFNCTSVYYSVAISFGKSFPNDIIDLMPFDFIQRYVGQPRRVLQEGSLYIELNRRTYEGLAKRLIEKIKNKMIKEAMTHVSWGDQTFVAVFLQHVEKEAKMKILFQTLDEQDRTVLYYGMKSTFNRCVDFNNFTEQVLKTGLWEKHMKKRPQLKEKQEKECLKLAVCSENVPTAVTLIQRMKSVDDDCYDAIIQNGSTYLLNTLYKFQTYKIDACTALIKTNKYHYQSDPARALKLAKILLSKEKDLLVKCHLRKALKEAIEADDANLLDMLKILGADLNVKFRDGSLLYLACMKGHVKCAEHLLDSAVDTSSAGPNGKTALHIAIENGHYKIASMLFTKYNGLLSICDKSNQQPLHIAAGKTNVLPDFLEEMIDLTANVGAKDKNNKTPLHFAISAKNFSSINVLTKRGSPVMVKDSDGHSPIVLAYKEGIYYDVESIFKNNGKTDFYESELLFEALKMQENSMVKCLLRQKNVNMKNTKGNTLLHVAIEMNLCPMVRLLLQEEEIDMELASNNILPIHKAVLQGNLDIFKLVASKANILSADHTSGNTVLHEAVKKDLYKFVEFILGKQPELVNKRNVKGETPLFMAVDSGQVEITELLLHYSDHLDTEQERRLSAIEQLALRKRNIAKGCKDAPKAELFNKIYNCLTKRKARSESTLY